MRFQIESLESRHLLSTLPIIDTHHEQIPAFGTGGVEITSPTWSGSSRTVDYVIPAGVTVTVDDLFDAAREIQVHGILRFDPTIDTRLTVETILVMPGGTLEMKPNPGVTSEIVIADAPIDLERDPEQHGHGILVLGSIDIEGSDKADFLRLSTAPRSGDTMLHLSEQPVGWSVGDTLIISDTRQLKAVDGKNVRHERTGRTTFLNNAFPQDERLTIAAIDGQTVALTAPLTFNHFGVGDFLPHVGNLSRNVSIRSESAGGVRGHILATDAAEVQIENSALVDMGRTTIEVMGPDNHIGRYSIHLHHLSNTEGFLASGERFVFDGNAVDTSPKWGIAVNDTHYGRISNNVVYNSAGAGIVQEDGSETGNHILHNFVVRSDGDGERVDQRLQLKIPTETGGHEGASYWLKGWNETVFVGNVASQAQWNGLIVFPKGYVDIPSAPGSDVRIHMLAGETTPAEVRGNEFYGAMRQAIQPWYQQAPFALYDTEAWNVSDAGFGTLYQTSHITVDGFTTRFSSSEPDNRYGVVGMRVQNIVEFSNIEITNANVGIDVHPIANLNVTGERYSRYSNLFLDNTLDMLIEGGIDSTDYSRRIDIVDSVFNGNVGLEMRYDPYHTSTRGTVFASDTVHVEIGGTMYRAYYHAQAGDFIVPQTTYYANGVIRVEGAPRSGMTNDEVFAEIGKAIAGAIAPDDAVSVVGHIGLFMEE